MAIVKNNIVIEGLSGPIGELVAKVYKRKTVITRKPGPSPFPRTSKQIQNSALFANAVAYAAGELADQSLLPRIKRVGYDLVRQQLISDYMHRNRVEELKAGLAKYHSRAQLKKLGCNERQLKAIAYMHKKKPISNAVYQELNSVSKATATRDLQFLVSNGIIRSSGRKGAGAGYILCRRTMKARIRSSAHL